MKLNEGKRMKIFAFHIPSTNKGKGVVVTDRFFAFEEMQSKKIYLCLERERKEPRCENSERLFGIESPAMEARMDNLSVRKFVQ